MADPEASCADLIVESPHFPVADICEENEDGGLFFVVHLSSGTGLNFDNGLWRIEGTNSSLFESVRGMTGNSQNGGFDLRISHVPDMPFYPQNLRISYRHPQLSNDISTIVRILDCDGDDPTCNDIAQELSPEEIEYLDNSETSELPENYKLIIYDILGNQV